MALTDEEFAAWLADDNAERLILAEMEYRDVAAGTDGVLYVGTMPFLTSDTDTPALQLYEDIILEVPEITRRLKPSLLGAADVSYGDLTIDNANGELDGWFDYAFEGRAIVIYIGDPTWARDDFQAIFVGTVEDVLATEEDVISVRLRDNSWYLNVPVVTDAIGGSGPNANEPEPICVGFCNNVEGILYDSATQVYKLGKGPIEAVIDVRDNGASLASPDFLILRDGGGIEIGPIVTAATDLVSSAAHGLSVNTRLQFQFSNNGIVAGQDYWVIAGGLTADAFKISTTRGGSALDITATPFATGSGRYRVFGWDADLVNGRITLISQPAGRITADVKGVTSTDSPTEWVRTLSQAIEYIVSNYTALPLEFLDPAQLPGDALFSPFIQPTIGLRIQGGDTVADLIEQLVSSVFAFYTFDRLGVLRVDRVFSPEGGDVTFPGTPEPDFTITEDDVDEDDGITHVRRDPVLGVLETGFLRNWTPMPDGIAGGVAAKYRAYLSSEYIVEPTRLAGVLETYPLAERLRQLTLLSDQRSTAFLTGEFFGGAPDIVYSHMESLRSYWATLWSHPRTVYRLPVNAIPFSRNLADVGEVTYPRMGFDDGANVIVIGIIEQPDETRATLEIWK